MKKLIHVLDKDKRKRKRVELFSNIPTKIQALGRSVSAKIKDVSYTGIGIVLSPHEEFLVIDSLETTIKLSNQIFQGNVANRIVLPSQEIKIGFSLPQELHKEVDFNTTDSSWDRVVDYETIQNIYHDLALKGIEVPVTIRQNFCNATVFPIKISESESLICEISEIHQGVLEKGKVKCTFDLFQTCHAFEGNIEKINQNIIEIKLSAVLARLLRRETVRIQKKNASFDIKIRLASKNFETTIEEYEVFDYSEHGISMLDPEGDLSLPRNLMFDDAVIEIEGIGTILGTAEIRSYQWNRSVNSYIVGLQFKPSDDPHLTNWHNLVLKARYPNLDFNYQEENHSQIWSLFERSGYVGLSTSGEFTHAFDISKQTWKKLKDAGTEISKRILIMDKELVLGHLQMDRIYPNTWSAHQLAIDPSKSKIVGREIYSVTADVLKAESSKYFTSITDVDKPWNKRSYYDFINSYPFPEHNEIKYYQVYEGKTDHKYDIEMPNDFKAVHPSKWDLTFISRYFEVHASKLEIEACALTQDQLYLENLNKIYSKYGLERRRDFLLLKKKEEIIGFSRLEFGTEATNIFGLLDLLYVYVVDEYLDQSGIIHDILISESLKYYKKNGRKDIIIYLNDSRKEYYISKGLNYIWDGVRWIATIDIVSRYHAFVQNLYGHLILKREKQKKYDKK